MELYLGEFISNLKKKPKTRKALIGFTAKVKQALGPAHLRKLCAWVLG